MNSLPNKFSIRFRCTFCTSLLFALSTFSQRFESIGLNYVGNEIENISLFMSILHSTTISLFAAIFPNRLKQNTIKSYLRKVRVILSTWTCEFLFSCWRKKKVFVIEAYARIFTFIKSENIVQFVLTSSYTDCSQRCCINP